MSLSPAPLNLSCLDFVYTLAKKFYPVNTAEKWQICGKPPCRPARPSGFAEAGPAALLPLAAILPWAQPGLEAQAGVKALNFLQKKFLI
jgi:hypothetical protein